MAPLWTNAPDTPAARLARRIYEMPRVRAAESDVDDYTATSWEQMIWLVAHRYRGAGAVPQFVYETVKKLYGERGGDLCALSDDDLISVLSVRKDLWHADMVDDIIDRIALHPEKSALP